MPKKVEWIDGVRIVTDMTPEEVAAIQPSVKMWRTTAHLSRSKFFIAAWQAGLISKEDAVLGARGETPQILADALADAVSEGYLTQAQADAAEIEFAGATRIDRANPSVELMRVSMDLTQEQVDALFGWGG